MITDWPISDHMNWDLTQRSHTAICVLLCLEDTAGTNRGAAHSQASRTVMCESSENLTIQES
ncbi:unnamed protein product [Staurois parvus]|uniref:Uncharacterized protein n=1 Tax=Staurois parvus TaxID=386267 RepID=A0ABN9FL96_9NEOB|nr:unnamed protein product [Staurois parvus]